MTNVERYLTYQPRSRRLGAEWTFCFGPSSHTVHRGGSLARPESPAVRRSWSSRGSRQRDTPGVVAVPSGMRACASKCDPPADMRQEGGSSARSSHRLEAGLAATAVVRARKSAPKAERCGFSEGGVLTSYQIFLNRPFTRSLHVGTHLSSSVTALSVIFAEPRRSALSR